MSSAPLRRKPIRPDDSVGVRDKDLDVSAEEYRGNSMAANTSSENSSQSIYQAESSKVSARNEGRSSSTRHTSKSGSYRNLENTFPPKKSAYSEKSQSHQMGCNAYIILTLFMVIGLFVFVMMPNSEKKCSYDKLSQRYPEQDEKLWRTISINIEHILNGRTKKPAVYLFIHQGGKEMPKLVKDIAAQASNCFGGQFQLVEMSKNDFTSASTIEDYGIAIEKFKEKIKNGRVALIVNLNEIPAGAARALHTICDTYTPIAEEMVIFLTLVTPSSTGNPVANAENTLMGLWSSKLKHNDLHALITRVTDEVIALKS